MDSLTQIVLGAAVGEAVLGKKVGNKAALWGGIAGTIPDLDVIGSFFLSELGNLGFHRSFTHSFVFAFLFGPVLGWLIYKKVYKEKEADLRGWQWLSFWAFITHPMLDCFTNWGTQFFYPFSNYRVAFNTIFIVDPIYTLPFAICLIIALFLKKESNARRYFNNAGLAISCFVLFMTWVNQLSAQAAFRNTLRQTGSSYQRMTVQPMPLNLLWYCVAEEEQGFRLGMYSVIGKTEDIVYRFIPKNESVYNDYPNPKTIDRLKWFSNGYAVLDKQHDSLMYRDLRFGLLNIEDTAQAPKYTFSFYLPAQKDADIVQIPPVAAGDEMKQWIQTWWRKTKGEK